MVGTCHIALGKACMDAYPGVGSFHCRRQKSYLGVYLAVGTYLGYYGICIYV